MGRTTRTYSHSSITKDSGYWFFTDLFTVSIMIMVFHTDAQENGVAQLPQSKDGGLQKHRTTGEYHSSNFISKTMTLSSKSSAFSSFRRVPSDNASSCH